MTNRLKLKVPRRTIATGPEGGELHILLGAIIRQAMHDGMTRIRIGIEPEENSPFMQYFGPTFYDSDRQIWWDMGPPEAECFPALFQICINFARLDATFPISGIIPAVKDKSKLDLHFTAHDLRSFEITWDRCHAEERQEGALLHSI